MNVLEKKEICLWLSPAGDGRVRRIKIGAFTLYSTLLICVTVALGLVFVASDYARVQVLKTKNFISLRHIAAERDKLLAVKAALENELGNLRAAGKKSALYEKLIKERLDELASILLSVQSEGVAVNDNPHESSRGGLGGGEYPCVGRKAKACREFAKRNQRHQNAKSILPPAKIMNASVPAVADGEPNVNTLLAQLDLYMDLLKNLPLSAPVSAPVNSGFGVRTSPFGAGLIMHEGIDFNMPKGSPVTATAEALVKEVKRHPTYGLVVDLLHKNNIVTRYAHLSKVYVSPGEHICRGEILGLVGSTGRSTGPHLHYEVLVAGHARNPIKFVKLATKLGSALG